MNAKLVVLLIVGSVLAVAGKPPVRSPKDAALARSLPTVSPRLLPSSSALYFVNFGGTNTCWASVDAGGNITLATPNHVPTILVPNITHAPLVLFQTSPNLTTWATVCYFTNAVNGFYLVDTSATTNQPMFFYRLVPVLP